MISTDSEAQARERHRLQKIGALIDSYEQGSISQASFLHELDALLGALELAEISWRDALKSEWWSIEQVFAASKEPDLKPSDEQAGMIIRVALSNMRKLLAEIEHG